MPSAAVFGLALLLAVSPPAPPAAHPAAPPTPEEAVAAARARAEALVLRGSPWSHQDAREVLGLALADPGRFAGDAAFRARALELLPTVLPEGAPEPLRDLLLYELESGPGLSFAESEALEVAWGAAPRASAGRGVERAGAPASPDLAFPDELRDPVEAILFSFPAPYVEPEAAGRLLAEIRRLAPEREIVVLADLPMRRRLEPAAGPLGVRLVETFGRPYSPWPRDPFSGAWSPDGELVLVERPGSQSGREEDRWMARELVQSLPEALDRAWGGEDGVAWAEAPVYFHNGHVLMAGDAAWTSIHALEPRSLQLLGLDRVPVASFTTEAGIDRYLAAAERARAELAELFGKPVRLVHPLPGSGEAAERAALMRRIGGGGGYDLDSLVTLLPGSGGESGTGSVAGGLQALVADLDEGKALLAELPAEDWSALRTTYGLAPAPTELADRVADAQRTPVAAGLDGFLDLVAEHLAASGMPVRRLPLVLVPVALLQDRELFHHDHFLVGWNNTVPDARGGAVRAEGFESGIPAGDARAREVYRAAGVELDLLPPLVWSVISNGGYRCASNEIRPVLSERSEPKELGGGKPTEPKDLGGGERSEPKEPGGGERSEPKDLGGGERSEPKDLGGGDPGERSELP